MKKKLLFSATLREIRYLIENNYLNKKGKEWANSFECIKEENLIEDPMALGKEKFCIKEDDLK